MTTNDIDAIRKLTDAATDGPWTREWAFSTHFVVPVTAADVASGNVARLKPRQRDDAEFIAAARTHVPALCDEVEQLRAELAAARTELAR